MFPAPAKRFFNSMLDLTTQTPLWCDNNPTSSLCYYPSENYLYYLDASFTTNLVFEGVIIFFVVAIFIKKLFEKI
jgi:hypothetical protein